MNDTTMVEITDYIMSITPAKQFNMGLLFMKFNNWPTEKNMRRDQKVSGLTTR
jgi:hypothetical protein